MAGLARSSSTFLVIPAADDRSPRDATRQPRRPNRARPLAPGPRVVAPGETGRTEKRMNSIAPGTLTRHPREADSACRTPVV